MDGSAGQEITIEITNDGSVLHEWVLMQPGVTIEAESELPDTEEASSPTSSTSRTRSTPEPPKH